MFEVFGEVKKHISTSGRYTPQVNSAILWTMKGGMLVTIMACVLVTAKNYIGDNINCITGSITEDQELKAIETYCFISSTFSMVDLSANEAPHPGVGVRYPLRDMTVAEYEKSLKEKEESGDTDEPSDETRVHTYYQWVPIVLALQAAIYYFPLWCWGQSEKGYFEMVLCGLNNISLDGEEKSKIESSSKYFARTLNHHNSYAVKFFLCECISFAIALGNIFFTNVFLGGEFLSYGPNALKYLNKPAYDVDNPLNEIFPKIAKCTWHKFGPSGTVQTYDSMCVLPLNIVNEKTYIFLWLAYISIAIITGLCLIFHLILLVAPTLRNTMLTRKVKDTKGKGELMNLLCDCDYGDWFLLENLRDHMAYFTEWLTSVNQERRDKKFS